MSISVSIRMRPILVSDTRYSPIPLVSASAIFDPIPALISRTRPKIIAKLTNPVISTLYERVLEVDRIRKFHFRPKPNVLPKMVMYVRPKQNILQV